MIATDIPPILTATPLLSNLVDVLRQRGQDIRPDLQRIERQHPDDCEARCSALRVYLREMSEKGLEVELLRIVLACTLEPYIVNGKARAVCEALTRHGVREAFENAASIEMAAAWGKP